MTFTTDEKRQFFRSYVITAGWSSLDDDGDPIDNDPDWRDRLTPESEVNMARDCLDFLRSFEDDLRAAMRARPDYDLGYAGHDFWLTRNGHGVGFWDRGLGEIGDRLTEMSRPYGDSDLYFGDDDKLYVTP